MRERVESFWTDLPGGIRAREIGQAVGHIRRILHIEEREPHVESAGLARIETLFGEEALGRFGASLLDHCDIVEVWIEALAIGLPEGIDEIIDLGACLCVGDPSRGELASFVECAGLLP